MKQCWFQPMAYCDVWTRPESVVPHHISSNNIDLFLFLFLFLQLTPGIAFEAVLHEYSIKQFFWDLCSNWSPLCTNLEGVLGRLGRGVPLRSPGSLHLWSDAGAILHQIQLMERLQIGHSGAWLSQPRFLWIPRQPHCRHLIQAWSLPQLLVQKLSCPLPSAPASVSGQTAETAVAPTLS